MVVVACLFYLGGIHLNKNHIKKSILAILIVIGILLISGLYYWLIFSQANGVAYIITIIMTSLISAILVLFVYNFMLKIKPRDKDVQVEAPKTTETDCEDDESDSIDIYSISNTTSSKTDDSNTKNADSCKEITV